MCSDGAGMTLKNEQERVTLCCAFIIRVGDKHFAARKEEPRLGTDRGLAASATKVRILCLVKFLSIQTCLHFSEAKAFKMRWD